MISTRFTQAQCSGKEEIRIEDERGDTYAFTATLLDVIGFSNVDLFATDESFIFVAGERYDLSDYMVSNTISVIILPKNKALASLNRSFLGKFFQPDLSSLIRLYCYRILSPSAHRAAVSLIRSHLGYSENKLIEVR